MRELQPRDLCRQNEAARLLGVMTTIRNAIADGSLTVIVVGCHKFLLRRELRKLPSRSRARKRIRKRR